jgi:activating signal cointegrator complex subunit 1
MGKKKTKGGYNDFTEDTRYSNTNNNEIRTSLQSTSTLTRNISPPAPSKPQTQRPNNAHNKGKPKKPPLTHFLCLPLITSTNRSHISAALDKLRKDVASYTPVPPKAVRPVGTLHLTLGVMSLSSSQLSDATQHLRELDIGQLLRSITTQAVAPKACDTPMVSEGFGAVENPGVNPMGAAGDGSPESLVVKLQGLVPMQRPRQTSILYAEPRDESGRLGRFAESVRSVFEERAWVVKDERGLRLHATVLNTIYAKPKGRGRGKGKEKVNSKAAVTGDVEGKEGEVDGDGGQEQQGTDGEAEKEERKEKRDGHGPDAKSWMRFDASSLIEMYEDFIWAEDVRIDRVQICKMGAKKILNEETGEVVDEEYEVVAEKRL